MLESVLIANRGEIACRIIRTCRRLGIRSIAVFSDADRNAEHVRLADEAVHLGPSEAAQSYLDPERIMKAAAASNAAGVHPGYGFLSEKPVLARRCVEDARTWIGPRAEVIEQMGSKTEAKKIAHAAGVMLVPGYHGDDQSEGRLASEAERIGFPILIKASAGGGGKGMRRVDRGADFLAQLALAKQEASRAFGDDRVLLERLVKRPRHLEVQLAGDLHGHLVHFHERECSIQRRFQKVIEEAPAAFLPDQAREKLFDYSLRLGRAIRYDSLGTVEFVLEEGTSEPYFLEMNTRLQVEHPVTEETCGVDLVELQLRIASGEDLPVVQSEITSRGWAIEARINCENPAREYRPELGTVVEYHAPDGVRVESGIARGDEVTPYYDSMIAKLIGRGATRAAAVRSLAAGLETFETLGVGTNQLFVRDLLTHPSFLEKPLTTGFIDEVFPDGWKPDARVERLARIVAAFGQLPHAKQGPWVAQSGFRNVAKGAGWARFVVALDDVRTPVWLARRDAAWEARVSGETVALDIAPAGPFHVLVRDARGPMRFGVFPGYVSKRGMRFAVQVTSELNARASAGTARGAQSGKITASLPGLVTTVNVAVGQAVNEGDVVLVMESMKLMFSLKAPIAGEVVSVSCKTGQTVSNGQLLVEIKP